MNGRSCHQLALIAAIALLAVPASAITLGQMDNFQSGTTEGWTVGTNPTNQPNGGPEGPGDHYLQLSTLGTPSNLGVFNTAQWSGDYIAAGVTRINIDLNNFGPDPVSLRLMIVTSTALMCPSPCTAWISKVATVLPAGSGWVRAEFSLAELDLEPVAGALSYASSMVDVKKLLIRHDDGGPSPPGTPVFVNTVLGIDNITALPEPSCSTGLTAGCFVLLSNDQLRRRRTRRESPLE